MIQSRLSQELGEFLSTSYEVNKSTKYTVGYLPRYGGGNIVLLQPLMHVGTQFVQPALHPKMRHVRQTQPSACDDVSVGAEKHLPGGNLNFTGTVLRT